MADTTSILSGIVGGAITAFLTHMLTKRKTDAEIQKLDAETKKILFDMANNAESLSATVNYHQLSGMAEQIIYNYAKGGSPHDFAGNEDYIYVEHKRVGGQAAGAFEIKNGILSIHRTNTEGRFQVWLQQYYYNDVESPVIPKNELMSGRRKLRVSCEAKVTDDDHTVRFVFKDEKADKWLGSEKKRITSDTWTQLDLYFQFSPLADVRFRIDDLEVSNAPSSVQIRNLVVAERVS